MYRRLRFRTGTGSRVKASRPGESRGGRTRRLSSLTRWRPPFDLSYRENPTNIASLLTATCRPVGNGYWIVTLSSFTPAYSAGEIIPLWP